MPNHLFPPGPGDVPGRPVPHEGEPYLYYPVRKPEPYIAERAQLVEYLEVIRRHARSITLLAIVGALAGVALAMLTRPEFRARTTLDIQQFDENILKMEMRPSRRTSPALRRNRTSRPRSKFCRATECRKGQSQN